MGLVGSHAKAIKGTNSKLTKIFLNIFPHLK